jgi:formyl-CoA transferase
MSVTGAPGQGPMRAGAAIADVATGLYAALGVMAALHERHRSGRGQWVQASLLQSALGLMDFQAARFLVDGEVPGQVGNDHPTSMPTSAYATRDGHINIGAGGQTIWARLCAAIGRPDLVQDARFADERARSVNRNDLNAVLSEVFASRSSNEWIEALNAAGVPCGPIYTVDQVFADPQVMHAGLAATVQHPTRGPVRVLAPGMVLSRTPGRLEGSLGPKGQDSDAVLAELGFSAEAIGRMRDQGVI